MKLILVILRGDSEKLTSTLTDANFRVTEFSSVGGFLRQKKTTLIIGVTEDRLESALNLIRESNPPNTTSEEHYATIFVLDAEEFIMI